MDSLALIGQPFFEVSIKTELFSVAADDVMGLFLCESETGSGSASAFCLELFSRQVRSRKKEKTNKQMIRIETTDITVKKRARVSFETKEKSPHAPAWFSA